MAPELIAVLAIVVLALVAVGRAVRVIQQSTNVTIETLPEVAAGEANKLLLLPTGAADAMSAVAGLGAALREGATPPEKPEPRRTPPPPTRPDAS
jgi:hypothetical protein